MVQELSKLVLLIIVVVRSLHNEKGGGGGVCDLYKQVHCLLIFCTESKWFEGFTHGFVFVSLKLLNP